MRGYPLTAAILAASFCVLPVRVPSAEDIHQPKGAPPASADANYNEDAWQTILPYQNVLGVLGKAKPLALLGPHSAPLGMRFYTGSMFPSEYRSAIFIARHGSWNRTKKVGGDIVVAKLNDDGTVKSIEPFMTGFIEDNNYVGRPADVVVLTDGSMLISDDFNGAVYRVTYGSARVGQ